MSNSRRNFFQDAMLFGAGLFGLNARLSDAEEPPGSQTQRRRPAEKSFPRAAVPMIAPDIEDLPFELDGATKVFRLHPMPMKLKIAPFKTIDVWGYNGSCPGPTIQVNQGDRVRIIVENAHHHTQLQLHGAVVADGGTDDHLAVEDGRR